MSMAARVPLGAARRARHDRHEVRLRDGAVRRLHRIGWLFSTRHPAPKQFLPWPRKGPAGDNGSPKDSAVASCYDSSSRPT